MAQAAGIEYEYEGIESKYSNDDLEMISYLESSEVEDKKVIAARYKIKSDDDHILIRYYKGEKLVTENVVKNDDSQEN